MKNRDGQTPKPLGFFVIFGFNLASRQLRRSSKGAGGIVAGFRLGEKGVLSLLNVEKDTEDLPIVLTGCVALENIEKWPVSVNGKINPKRKVVVANGALRLCRDGLSVIVR